MCCCLLGWCLSAVTILDQKSCAFLIRLIILAGDLSSVNILYVGCRYCMVMGCSRGSFDRPQYVSAYWVWLKYLITKNDIEVKVCELWHTLQTGQRQCCYYLNIRAHLMLIGDGWNVSHHHQVVRALHHKVTFCFFTLKESFCFIPRSWRQ